MEEANIFGLIKIVIRENSNKGAWTARVRTFLRMGIYLLVGGNQIRNMEKVNIFVKVEKF